MRLHALRARMHCDSRAHCGLSLTCYEVIKRVGRVHEDATRMLATFRPSRHVKMLCWRVAITSATSRARRARGIWRTTREKRTNGQRSIGQRYLVRKRSGVSDVFCGCYEDANTTFSPEETTRKLIPWNLGFTPLARDDHDRQRMIVEVCRDVVIAADSTYLVVGEVSGADIEQIVSAPSLVDHSSQLIRQKHTMTLTRCRTGTPLPSPV